jgi:hypothetical protein
VNVVGKQRRAVLGSMPEYLGAVRKAFPQRVSVIEDHYVFVDRVPWDGSPEANQGIPTLRARWRHPHPAFGATKPTEQ